MTTATTRPFVAGLYRLPAEWGEGHRSCWTPCLRCDEVDAVTAKAAELAAHIYVEPTDAGTCVRYSAVQSPSGEVITLYRHVNPT
jgi:predicted enzyme related to lactoylglutathione lyase